VGEEGVRKSSGQKLHDQKHAKKWFEKRQNKRKERTTKVLVDRAPQGAGGGIHLKRGEEGEQKKWMRRSGLILACRRGGNQG